MMYVCGVVVRASIDGGNKGVPEFFYSMVWGLRGGNYFDMGLGNIDFARSRTSIRTLLAWQTK
jgi:hypothetical protein